MTSSYGTRYFLDKKGEVWHRKITYECYTPANGCLVIPREEWETSHGSAVELFPATNPSEEAVRVAPTSWPADLPPYGTVITPSVRPEPDRRLIFAGHHLSQEVILLYDHATKNWRFLTILPTFRNRHEYTWEQTRRGATSSFEVIGATQKETP